MWPPSLLRRVRAFAAESSEVLCFASLEKSGPLRSLISQRSLECRPPVGVDWTNTFGILSSIYSVSFFFLVSFTFIVSLDIILTKMTKKERQQTRGKSNSKHFSNRKKVYFWKRLLQTLCLKRWFLGEKIPLFYIILLKFVWNLCICKKVILESILTSTWNKL